MTVFRGNNGEHSGIPKGEKHYHLAVRTPAGRTFEPLEAESIRDTITVIMESALDKLDSNLSIDDIRISWRGQVLHKDTKLIDVEVDGNKLPFYSHTNDIPPLVLTIVDSKNPQEETSETKGA